MPNNNAFPGSLASMLVFIFSMQGTRVCANEDSVCPDMSEHEQTLNQAEQYYQEHGGGGGSGDGFGFPDVGWERHAERKPESISPGSSTGVIGPFENWDELFEADHRWGLTSLKDMEWNSPQFKEWLTDYRAARIDEE